APKTRHYSFEKVCDVLGLGRAQLQTVPLGRDFTMSVDALREQLRDLAREHRPVLAVVAVCGTTEEGSIDRLHEVAKLRTEMAQHGLHFWLHCDAAWGGYVASLLWDENGQRKSLDAIRNFLRTPDCPCEDWPSRDWYEALCALSEADSVTIDPHKLGYIPYPAGAIVFRSPEVKQAIACVAPYIATSGEKEDFIGNFILEGSKPGAAAAACYLSHQMIPRAKNRSDSLVEVLLYLLAGLPILQVIANLSKVR
ncbi:MAG: hypothetical protein UT11_C0066G0001, partial [Berkelbacteria bacterium GW2011_GWA2_38_9]